MAEIENHAFTMDDNLLLSVIKAQAGSLAKALLEGVMNSIDAGASRVDIQLSATEFEIKDNGKGFSSEQEIVQWFGRFGTKHEEGDALFGRYRMGRGQLMAFAATEWRSGAFRMIVDIEKAGLGYSLIREAEVQPGCIVKGKLYKEQPEYRLQDTLSTLKKLVAYMPQPVYVNGHLFGASPARLKAWWTFEDDFAWYRVAPETTELEIYNQGAFVDSKPAWSCGFGGVVVSKKALQVNFARNAVMEDTCPTWAAINQVLQRITLDKLSAARKLTEDERRYLARRITSFEGVNSSIVQSAKVLSEPSGRNVALSELKKYRRFVHIDSEGLACAVHGNDGTFVVTEALLARFGCYDLSQWLGRMERLHGVLNEDYEVIDVSAVEHLGLGASERVDKDGLSRKERAAFDTLVWLNDELAYKLRALGQVAAKRGLDIGKHKKTSFVAWTDGSSYITVNQRYLKLLETGLDGVMNWLLTLVHEYMHDTDDSESHSHGSVFYTKFHDTVFMGNGLSLGSLAQEGLKKYLDNLREQGLSRPHVLTRQLKAQG